MFRDPPDNQIGLKLPRPQEGVSLSRCHVATLQQRTVEALSPQRSTSGDARKVRALDAAPPQGQGDTETLVMTARDRPPLAPAP